MTNSSGIHPHTTAAAFAHIKSIEIEIEPHLVRIIAGCDRMSECGDLRVSEFAQHARKFHARTREGLCALSLACSPENVASQVHSPGNLAIGVIAELQALCDQVRLQNTDSSPFSEDVRTVASDIAAVLKVLNSCVAHFTAATADGPPVSQASADDTETNGLADTHVTWLEALPYRLLEEVNHDFRNQLVTLKGIERALRRSSASDSLAETIDIFSASLAQMQRLTNDICDYRETMRETAVPQFTEFVLRDLIDRSVAGASLRHPQVSGIRVEADLSLPPVHCDGMLLGRILDNLLDNACRFTQGGTVICRARFDGFADEPWFVIEVLDTGRGLSLEEQSMLFSPFPKIVSREQHPESTGLGLVICRRLCAALGGTIRVDPERTALGKGAAFVVRLPVRFRAPQQENRAATRQRILSNGADQDAGATTIPTSQPRDSVNPAVSRGRILIVDDEPEIRGQLRKLLKEMGHRVEEVANGEDAIARLHSTPGSVDLMLLDLKMSGRTGEDVLQHVKNDYELRSLPVIVVSGDIRKDSIAHCIKLGADDFLEKPWNESLLKARVASCLLKGQVRRNERRLYHQMIAAKRRADRLLYKVFPYSIAEELRTSKRVQPRAFDNVAVMFCDLVSFTTFCAKQKPRKVVRILDRLFRAYEDSAWQYRVERIKIIGDCFMVTAGLLNRFCNPVLSCLACADEIRDIAGHAGFEVRIGIHAGPVVAGMVGQHFSFDVWGDTVNTAQRVETEAGAHQIFVSEPAWAQVYRYCHGESVGNRTLKGKSDMELFRFKGFRESRRTAIDALLQMRKLPFPNAENSEHAIAIAAECSQEPR